MHETGQKWFAKLNAAVTQLREGNPLLICLTRPLHM
jgi:hypothetical protein